MHLHKLIHQFKVLIDHGTFTAAGEALCISQPTLTQNIKRLEKSLDTALIIRNSKGLSMTLYGESLYKHACLLERSYNQALSEIESIKNLQRQSLVLECGYAWSHGQLLFVLQQYIKQEPNIKILIKNSNTDDCQDRLMKGVCDLAFGAIPSKEKQNKAIHYKAIFDTQFTLFCSPNHSFAKQKKITREQLDKSDWIVLKHDGEEINHFDPYGYPYQHDKIRFEVYSVTSALSLLHESECVMALSSQLRDEAKRRGLVELSSEFKFPVYTTGLMYTDDALLLEHKRKLIDNIMNMKID